MFSILLGYEKHGRNVFIMLSEEYGPPGVLINIGNPLYLAREDTNIAFEHSSRPIPWTLYRTAA